jgi:hypothetical protein
VAIFQREVIGRWRDEWRGELEINQAVQAAPWIDPPIEERGNL